MKIDKICLYSNAGIRYNIFPTLLLTPMQGGFLLALKFMQFHAGIRVKKKA